MLRVQRFHHISPSNPFPPPQWLTPKEREELRRQVREAEEAEAERKRRVYVTLDLVGRQARRIPLSPHRSKSALTLATDIWLFACVSG